MSAPDEEIAQTVKEWLTCAAEDLRLAEHALTMTAQVPYRLIAYHAQQCAEKCLKAYLVFRRVDFPYTHNIARLVELCGEHAGWADRLHDAEELTPFASITRYPGPMDEVTESEALRAIHLAAMAQRVVTGALADEGAALA